MSIDDKFLAQLLILPLQTGMWLILGRWALRILVGKQDNAILNLFELVTNPIYKLANRLTFHKFDDMGVRISALALTIIGQLLVQALFIVWRLLTY